ncbi:MULTISPECIES: YaiI/YqxD family protein [unclassified Acinetobacter]|uniref:YaiI/YqxD family protein n=1 Tax=unclassified Acinetobacter TaxID=196816 RepID=UPI0035B858CD
MNNPISQDTPFQLWVDADALPNMLRELILKASDRFKMPVTFVANQALNIPRSTRIQCLQVLSGADAADQMIVEKMQAGDIVVTQDIPLANLVIEKGGTAIHPRGEIFTVANIKARLHLRDFMDTLRGAGVQTGGASPMNERDKREFANALEKTVQKQIRITKLSTS